MEGTVRDDNGLYTTAASYANRRLPQLAAITPTIGENPLDQNILTDYLIQQLSTLIKDFMAAGNR
jgi:hypothetical protein